MTRSGPAGRAAVAGAGAVLAGSLFLAWFPGVSGWEQWAWADVVLVVLAVALVVAAFVRPRAAVRVPLAVLCALGVAVVLGHGLEPRVDVGESFGDVRAGAYLCLGALAAGLVASLAPWPRPAGRVLLVAGAGGIVAALLSAWPGERMREVSAGTTAEWARAYPDGFARWDVLDIVLVALAAVLLVVAAGRSPRLLSAAAAAVCVLAAACVLVAGNRGLWVGDGGGVWGIPMAGLAALLALFAGVAGLALVPRPPASAARDG